MKRTSMILMVSMALILTGGCTTMQRIQVVTDPPGADVTLAKTGVMAVSGHTPGVLYTKAEAEAFEGPPITLGQSPVQYEFPLNETEASAHVPGLLYVGKERLIREGVVRAELHGMVTEKRIVFTGEPIELELVIRANEP